MRHSLRKNKTSRRSKVKKIVHNSKKINCVTRFGKNIGNLEDVPAYSNCNYLYESGFDNIIRYKNKNVFFLG